MSKWLKILEKFMGTGKRCVYCRREIKEGVICENCANQEIDITPQNHSDGDCAFVFYYDDPAKKIIHEMKYNDMPRHASYIARKMFETAETMGINADIVSYVPVHKSRLRERGFDQSEAIAAHLSFLMGLPLTALFSRTKKTRPQYDLNARERAENMKDAFALTNEAKNAFGKTVLLVDDIYTTGSSMKECGKLLQNHAKIIPFAFCRDKN